MRSGRPPWPDVLGPIARLKWFASDALGMKAWGRPLPLPEVEGHRFDRIRVLRDPACGHEECFLVSRSDDLHRALEVRFVRWGSSLEGAVEWYNGSRPHMSLGGLSPLQAFYVRLPPERILGFADSWLWDGGSLNGN
jgi:hypothetical protein